jgi:hypothetical protein
MKLQQIETILGEPAFRTGVLTPNEVGERGRLKFNLSEPAFGTGRAAYWTCLLGQVQYIDPVLDQGKFCLAIDEDGHGQWVMATVCDKHARILAPRGR